MICVYCQAAGELQVKHRASPTKEAEEMINKLYEQCKGCACAKRIIWGNVTTKRST